MKILYIEHYAGSPEMGMEYRPFYLAKQWVNTGNTVTIIAGDYSHLRRKNPVVSTDFQSEKIDGIEYVWIKTGSYQGNGINRALTMFKFVYKIIKNAKSIVSRYNPDVVIASSTYPLDTYAAQKIKKLAKAKYIHEVHDMWPSTLYEVGGMSKNNPFVVAMQIAENSAYKHCDECVALLPYAKDYMIKHGLDPIKFNNIQNGVVLNEWDNMEVIPEEHKVFFESQKDKFIVGYFGGHALSNALDYALDVAKKIQTIQEDILFVFVGDGVEKNRLIERAKEESIQNVVFLPPVNKRAVPDLLRYFDCSYMTGMPSPLYRFGLCLNKMYDSMMSGLPIVCAFDAPDTLVRIHNCGYQCSPQKPDEVAKAILNIYKMPANGRNELGKNGREAVLRNYTYEKLAEKFIELM